MGVVRRYYIYCKRIILSSTLTKIKNEFMICAIIKIKHSEEMLIMKFPFYYIKDTRRNIFFSIKYTSRILPI